MVSWNLNTLPAGPPHSTWRNWLKEKPTNRSATGRACPAIYANRMAKPSEILQGVGIGSNQGASLRGSKKSASSLIHETRRLNIIHAPGHQNRFTTPARQTQMSATIVDHDRRRASSPIGKPALQMILQLHKPPSWAVAASVARPPRRVLSLSWPRASWSFWRARCSSWGFGGDEGHPERSSSENNVWPSDANRVQPPMSAGFFFVEIQSTSFFT